MSTPAKTLAERRARRAIPRVRRAAAKAREIWWQQRDTNLCCSSCGGSHPSTARRGPRPALRALKDDMAKAETTLAKYTGTPLEIGHQVFANYCLPVIKAASATTGVDGEQMAHLYAGFLQSCMGSLAADFGHEQAIHLVDMLADSFKKADLGSKAPTAH